MKPTPHNDADEWAEVPTIDSPDFGSVCEFDKGAHLHPPLLTEKNDATERVLTFAKEWRMLRLCTALTTKQWERLVSQHMLLPIEHDQSNHG